MAYINPVPSLGNNLSNTSVEGESDYKSMSEVYFAFIDVLGFKKTFDDMKISQKEGVVEKYKDVFNYYFALMNASKFMEQGKSTGCYAGQTSDSLYFYTERTDYLMQFIKIFSHFSLYAMSKDVFFRGGIAKGSLFTKKEYQFYGDSVIGAYLLESNISKNPIIVIDEQTHIDMSNEDGYKDITETKCERHYIKPFEYFEKNIVLDIDEGFSLKEIDYSQIESNIIRNKEAFEYDANNYAKYVFLLEQLKSRNNKPENEIE